MSTWSSRIRLRVDEPADWSASPEHLLWKGEIGVSIDPVSGQGIMRVGGVGGTRWEEGGMALGWDAVRTSLSLVEPSGSGSDGAMIAHDGTMWQADVAPIEFPVTRPSGALRYVAATDSWSTDVGLALLGEDCDGGTYVTGNYVAPSFAGGWTPTLGSSS